MIVTLRLGYCCAAAVASIDAKTSAAATETMNPVFTYASPVSLILFCRAGMIGNNRYGR